MPDVFEPISGLTFEHNGPLTPEQISKVLHYRTLGNLLYKNMLARSVTEYNPKTKEFKTVVKGGSRSPVGMILTELRKEPGITVQVPMFSGILGDELSNIMNAGVTGQETLTGQEGAMQFRHLAVQAGLQRMAGIVEHLQVEKQLTSLNLKQLLKTGVDLDASRLLDQAIHFALRANVSPNLVREYGVSGTATATANAVTVRTHADFDQHDWYVKADGTLSSSAADLSTAGYLKKNTLSQIAIKMDAIGAQMVQVKGASFYLLICPVEDCLTLKSDTDWMKMRAYGKDLLKAAGSFDQWEPFGWDGVLVMQARNSRHLNWNAYDYGSVTREQVTRNGELIWQVSMDTRSDLAGGSLTTSQVHDLICLGANAFGYADCSGGLVPITRETTDYGRILGRGIYHHYGIMRSDWVNHKQSSDVINQSSISIKVRNAS